jgi:hypothetical protein
VTNGDPGRIIRDRSMITVDFAHRAGRRLDDEDCQIVSSRSWLKSRMARICAASRATVTLEPISFTLFIKATME